MHFLWWQVCTRTQRRLALWSQVWPHYTPTLPPVQKTWAYNKTFRAWIYNTPQGVGQSLQKLACLDIGREGRRESYPLYLKIIVRVAIASATASVCDLHLRTLFQYQRPDLNNHSYMQYVHVTESVFANPCQLVVSAEQGWRWPVGCSGRTGTTPALLSKQKEEAYTHSHIHRDIIL